MRLALLMAARRKESSIAILGGDALPLAKICSFLDPVLVGFPAFALHERIGPSGGRSIVLHLDMATQRFYMHEAKVDAGGVQAVQLRGSWRELGAGLEALGTCRIELTGTHTSRGSASTDDGSAGAIVWDPPPPTSLAPSVSSSTAGGGGGASSQDSATSLQLTVRWDRRHTCLIAEISGGARLHEATLAEVGAARRITEAATAADACAEDIWANEVH